MTPRPMKRAFSDRAGGGEPKSVIEGKRRQLECHSPAVTGGQKKEAVMTSGMLKCTRFVRAGPVRSEDIRKLAWDGGFW